MESFQKANSSSPSFPPFWERFPWKKVEKTVYLISKIFTNMKKRIILNNKISHCSYEMANSKSPFYGVQLVSLSLLSIPPGLKTAMSQAPKSYSPNNFSASASKKSNQKQKKALSHCLCCKQQALKERMQKRQCNFCKQTMHFSPSSLSASILKVQNLISNINRADYQKYKHKITLKQSSALQHIIIIVFISSVPRCTNTDLASCKLLVYVLEASKECETSLRFSPLVQE